MRRAYYIFMARFIFALFAAMAVIVPASGQRYSFHNLNVDDGLIQSQAMCLAQDKAGNLWVGTLGGLSRYDGKTFTNYNVRNGLANNVVNALAPDDSGNIWIGTATGLSLFNGRSFTNFVVPERPSLAARNPARRDGPAQIKVIGDTVWWRTQGDVYYLTTNKLRLFPTPCQEGRTSAMLAEKGGCWVAQSDTVYHFSANHWDTLAFLLPPGDKGPTITRIFKDKRNVVWLATTAGLYYLEGNNIVAYLVNGLPLNFIAIRAIAEDRSGALWMATHAGVLKLSDNAISTYNKHNGLTDNPFHDVMTDAEGNIWMASDGQGIFRFSGTQFTSLDETMGLPSSQIIAIASNKRDSLFLGTYEAGLFVFKDDKVTPMPIPAPVVPSITSICYAHNQKLWIGTRDQGLFLYRKNVWTQFIAPLHHFPSNAIFSLYEDPRHRLWIGFGDGAVLYENDTFKTVDVRQANVKSFLALGTDSVLIATEKKGMLLYYNGQISDFTTGTIADSSSVDCFTKKGNEIWLGTSDNGVVRYDLETHKALIVNKANGLRSDFIYNIIADDEGNIWVGTGFGIHKITIDKSGVPHVTFFGKDQGVTGMESNIDAVLKLRDGSIWFGTTNGAMHYQPHSVVVSSAPTSITLQSVKLVGEASIDRSYYDSSDNWYGIPYHLRLPFKKNNISFSFQAITLTGAEQVLYRYRMEGVEQPWSDWSATNSVTYSALPPGKYVFYVQCMGSGEVGKYPELSYSFEIITPFQKTQWFSLLILGGCILAGILLQSFITSRFRRRQKLRAKLRAEEQAKIRMRTAEDFHDEIGNKLTRINVLTNVLKSKVTPSPDVTRILGQIEENTSQLYGGTRDILWSLKPSNDSLYEILLRVHDFGGELFQDTEVHFTVTGIEERFRNYKLPMDLSRNLIMIFKEALNNILKYANAKNVTLQVTMKRREVLQLILKDDGIGFDTKLIKKGNGINNMLVRAERINGKLYIDSRSGKGTIISMTFRVPRKGYFN